jgi:hypothetical protein
MNRIILIFFCLVNSFCFSQYRKNDGNRIGLSGGITQTSLFTSNFNTKPELGWIAGLSVRGNFYNDKWSMVFGMQFTESNFSVETTNLLFQKQNVKYTLSGAQVRILGSYHLVKDYLALDFGPVLQVNGNLKVENQFKNNLISGTALLAEEIDEISNINGNLYLGLSGGSKRVRGVIFYQYGVSNMFNKLNKDNALVIKNNGDEFKANLGMISGQLLINL